MVDLFLKRFLLLLLLSFWLVREIKSILFWVYLWQLKNYHLKRFLDHFRTAKGKSIFLNWIFEVKIVVLLGLFLIPFIFVPILISIYFLETLKTFFDALKKKLKKPIFTPKAIIISIVSIFTVTLSGLYQFFVFDNFSNIFFWLLIFDIFTPCLVALFVFAFHPITLFFQYRLLKKAKKKREKFKDLIVIGITGSYGKTSTKEILSAILEKKFNILKTKKHINAEVGIAKTILNELDNQDIFVVEIGAYEKGKIRQVCNIIRPKIGILTGINQQHMATFGSQENIIEGKFELIEALPEDGIAVLNWDNRFIVQKSKSKNQNPKFKIIKFGVSNKKELDVWAEDIRVEKEKLSFWVSTKEGEKAFCNVNLVGGHNVYPILAAISVVKELGMDLKEVCHIVENINQNIGAIVIRKGKWGVNIIDDSYSANPDGVFSALDYLKIWEGKKIIVMPSLIELGAASSEVHKKIGEKIAKVCDLAIITTKDKFREIKKGALLSGMEEKKIILAQNPWQILENIKSFGVSSNDVVLLEGRVPEKLKDLLIN